MDITKPFLCIPDLQIPFEAKKSLTFCLYLQRHYKIPRGNIICLGDETDQYYGSLYKLDINAHLTASAEIERTLSTLEDWYKAFPKMRVCISNHGTRWQRKALDCGIPQVLMKKYHEWIRAPESWTWHKKIRVETKHPFLAEHGDDWSGTAPHVKATMYNGVSTIMGHHHSKANIDQVDLGDRKLWGCVSGALINFEEFAFNYARAHAKKPVNGATVILNHGRMPVFHPLE